MRHNSQVDRHLRQARSWTSQTWGQRKAIKVSVPQHWYFWRGVDLLFTLRAVSKVGLVSVAVSYTSVYYVSQSQKVATGYANNKIHKEAASEAV